MCWWLRAFTNAAISKTLSCAFYSELETNIPHSMFILLQKIKVEKKQDLVAFVLLVQLKCNRTKLCGLNLVKLERAERNPKNTLHGEPFSQLFSTLEPHVKSKIQKQLE